MLKKNQYPADLHRLALSLPSSMNHQNLKWKTANVREAVKSKKKNLGRTSKNGGGGNEAKIKNCNETLIIISKLFKTLKEIPL